MVKKLYKIANAIENLQDLNKLSAALINVIMQAKPMISADKVGVLYEEERRALVHPRRIRAYKKVYIQRLYMYPS